MTMTMVLSQVLRATAAAAPLLVIVPAAHAGCGLTLTFDNDAGQQATVLEIESKSAAGKYETVHKKNIEVAAGKKVDVAVETNVGCAMPQYVRAKYEIGKNTKYVSKGPLVTAVDKKFTLELDR